EGPAGRRQGVRRQAGQVREIFQRRTGEMSGSLAALLADHRAHAAVLDAAPWRDTIASVADAYRVQDELAALAGNDVRAWKVTALGAEQQKGYRSDRPV